MLLRVGRVTVRGRGIWSQRRSRTDYKHTHDPQFLLERTAREDPGELMVDFAGKKLAILAC